MSNAAEREGLDFRRVGARWTRAESGSSSWHSGGRSVAAGASQSAAQFDSQSRKSTGSSSNAVSCFRGVSDDRGDHVAVDGRVVLVVNGAAREHLFAERQLRWDWKVVVGSMCSKPTSRASCRTRLDLERRIGAVHLGQESPASSWSTPGRRWTSSPRFRRKWRLGNWRHLLLGRAAFRTHLENFWW